MVRPIPRADRSPQLLTSANQTVKRRRRGVSTTNRGACRASEAVGWVRPPTRRGKPRSVRSLETRQFGTCSEPRLSPVRNCAPSGLVAGGERRPARQLSLLRNLRSCRDSARSTGLKVTLFLRKPAVGNRLSMQRREKPAVLGTSVPFSLLPIKPIVPYPHKLTSMRNRFKRKVTKYGNV